MNNLENITQEIKNEIVCILEQQANLEDEKIKDLITERVFETSQGTYLRAEQKAEIIEKICSLDYFSDDTPSSYSIRSVYK
jgi:hypothetical protein